MIEQTSLKKKTISGLFWSFTELIANQGFQFIILIILARILSPDDFGIIGMTVIFIALSQSIVDSGMTQALIRAEKVSQKDYSTVFYFNLLISLVMYAFIYISAESISDFFREPQLVIILRVLAIIPIINSFGLIQRTMMIRKIDFKSQTQISVISSVTSGAVAVFLAFLGFGVWSLVIRNISMQFMQALLLTFFNKWRPTLEFSVESFKRFFGFGWKLLVSGLIDTIYKNIYFVIIGRLYSATELGYYTNSQRLRDMLAQSITSSIQKVSYPVLSKFQNDDHKLNLGYKKIIKTAAFIIFPIMIGLAAVATPLISLILGDKWIPSISYFQLLCFAGMLYPIHAINLNILKVKGRSDLFLILEIYKKALLTILIVLALWLELGIFGLIGAAVTSSYIGLLVNSYFSAKVIFYSTGEQLRDIAPVFIISIIMGGFVYISGMILPWNNLLLLAFQVIIGVVLYVIGCKVAKVEELTSVKKIGLTVLSRLKLHMKK